MLKSQNKSSSIEKCEHDIRSSIELDCITSLLIGEKEFYYYLIKYDMFLDSLRLYVTIHFFLEHLS